MGGDLLYVFRYHAYAPDVKLHHIRGQQLLASQLTALRVERRGKHEHLHTGRAQRLHTRDLLRPFALQQHVSFVKAQRLRIFQTDFPLRHELQRPAPACHQQVTTALQLLPLLLAVQIPMNNRNPHTRAACQFLGHLGDLSHELVRGRDDDCRRLLDVAARALCRPALALVVEAGNEGHEIGGGLAGAGFSCGNEGGARGNDGAGVSAQDVTKR
jgi:hypothetical protein